MKKKKAEEKFVEASKKLKVLWFGQEEKPKAGERDFHMIEEKAKNVLAVNRKVVEECKSSKSKQSLAEIWNTGNTKMQKHLVDIMNQQT